MAKTNFHNNIVLSFSKFYLFLFSLLYVTHGKMNNLFQNINSKIDEYLEASGTPPADISEKYINLGDENVHFCSLVNVKFHTFFTVKRPKFIKKIFKTSNFIQSCQIH